jgi:capsular polysaccharide biosynthesis protein
MNHDQREFSDALLDRYTIDDYWMVLYRRRWMILLVTICAAAFSALMSYAVAPRYEAVAEFYVPQDVVGPVGGADARNLRIPGSKQDAWTFIALLEGGDAHEKIAARFPGKTADDLSRDVDLLVTRGRGVKVYARDTDPKVAAAIANSFIDYVNEFHLSVVRRDLAKQLQSLEEEIERQPYFVATLRNIKERLFTQMLRLSDPVVITQTATSPKTPVFPVIPLNVLVASFGGFVAGVLYALLLDHLEIRRRMRKLRCLQMVDRASAWLKRNADIEGT